MKKQNSNQIEEGDPNYFGTILSQHAGGETMAILSEELHACVTAASERGAPAVLTLSFKVEVKKGRVKLTSKFKANLPTEQLESQYFVGKGGILSRTNPNQKQFDFDPQEIEQTQEPKAEKAVTN